MDANAERLTIHMNLPDLRAQDVRDRWCAAIVCAAFLFAVGVPALQSLTAPKHQSAVGQQTVALSGAASLVSKGSPLLIIGICLVVIILYIRQIPRTGVASLVVLLLPWAYTVIRDRYLGGSTHLNELCYPLICTAIWFLRPRLSALKVLGYLVGATAILSIVMGEFLPLKGLYQSAVGSEIALDKQIFSGGILVGPLASGNNLGQFLVMGTAAILLIRNRTWRVILLVSCVYAQLWAASRSCLLAAAVMAVLALTMRAVPRGIRSVAAAGTLIALSVTAVAVPFLTTDPTSFSNRGYVWEVSRKAWAGDRLFGLGSSYYGRIATTSSNLGGSVFHGHNQFIQDLVTGGAVLAVLMGILLALEIAVASQLVRLGHRFGALYLVGFIGACLFEVSFGMVDRYFTLPVMVIPFACILFTADRVRPSVVSDVTAGTEVRPARELGADPRAPAARTQLVPRPLPPASNASPARDIRPGRALPTNAAGAVGSYHKRVRQARSRRPVPRVAGTRRSQYW